MSILASDQKRITDHFRTVTQRLIDFCNNHNTHADYAIDIASKLRILFHDHGQSKSLFGQYLKLQNKEKNSILFCDSAEASDPNNLWDWFPLCSLTLTDRPSFKAVDNTVIIEGSKLTHKWYFNRERKNYILVPFDAWWNGSLVLRPDEKKYQFSRKKLIVDRLANQDGGAHVDSNIESAYSDIISGKFLGNTAISLVSPEPKLIIYNTVRQIAEEVLESFEILGYIGKISLPTPQST